MKILSYITYLTIILGIYSCESSNKPNTNPLDYKFEQPYFKIDPYIPYQNIINRINIGVIHNYDTNIDSSYIRATFYDNYEFRDIGDFYFNNTKVEKYEAEDLFGIFQIVDDFIEFGEAYYSNEINNSLKDSVHIYNSNTTEFVNFEIIINSIKDKLIVSNVSDLQQISKYNDFTILTNLEKYKDTRIRFYNESSNFIFYSNSKDSIKFDVNSLNTLEPNSYKVEVLKGKYRVDTLSNGESIITNQYSSFIFNTLITE